ncbi:MAG: N-acetylmuramoyl-L-alanine amidase, partial [Nannocystaceae bacterium]|nr:N-acetylmuramoyl-L-alanine amidase [Nannocystaceae bacterium]
TQEYGIPRDASHIVAHGQLQANRTDPGAAWPWDDYIDLVRFHCGEPPVFREIIVDSNDSNNDPSFADMEVSASWTSSAGTPGYWETGYYFSTTQAVSDQANFWFYLYEAGPHTVDAWWTAGANRSSTAPFQAYNASGSWLATVPTDQSVDGGQWNELGTFNFTAGWNRIALSRWTTSGYVVIADAVRIH